MQTAERSEHLEMRMRLGISALNDPLPPSNAALLEYVSSEVLKASSLIDGRVLKRLFSCPRAASAVQYACGHLESATSLEEIGRFVGMNPSAFSRFFTQKVGVSFSALLRMIRIEVAIAAMKRGDCSIYLLAEKVGYESTRAFSRAFKSVTTMTPSDYRRLAARGDEIE